MKRAIMAIMALAIMCQLIAITAALADGIDPIHPVPFGHDHNQNFVQGSRSHQTDQSFWDWFLVLLDSLQR